MKTAHLSSVEDRRCQNCQSCSVRPTKLIPCVSENGIRGHSWLRQEFACSIPDVVIGIYRGINPSGRHMELGSTQPLPEISMRDISWGKSGRYIGLTSLATSCIDRLGYLGTLTYWNPKVLSRPVMG
jgi:hypothetical protein